MLWIPFTGPMGGGFVLGARFVWIVLAFDEVDRFGYIGSGGRARAMSLSEVVELKVFVGRAQLRAWWCSGCGVACRAVASL